MIFSEYIIKERSENFYYMVCGDIAKHKNITIEKYLSNMYEDYKFLYLNNKDFDAS